MDIPLLPSFLEEVWFPDEGFYTTRVTFSIIGVVS